MTRRVLCLVVCVQIRADLVTYTSDRFEEFKEYALVMIKSGDAYMDDTPQVSNASSVKCLLDFSLFLDLCLILSLPFPPTAVVVFAFSLSSSMYVPFLVLSLFLINSYVTYVRLTAFVSPCVCFFPCLFLAFYLCFASIFASHLSPPSQFISDCNSVLSLWASCRVDALILRLLLFIFSSPFHS